MVLGCLFIGFSLVSFPAAQAIGRGPTAALTSSSDVNSAEAERKRVFRAVERVGILRHSLAVFSDPSWVAPTTMHASCQANLLER
jgi:hypothetical protein